MAFLNWRYQGKARSRRLFALKMRIGDLCKLRFVTRIIFLFADHPERYKALV